MIDDGPKRSNAGGTTQEEPKSSKVLLGCGGTFIAAMLLLGIVLQISKSSKDAETEAALPPIRIEAGALIAAYADNELAADTKYKGHRVVVTGDVALIGNDRKGNAFVLLGSGSGGSRAVQLFLKDRDEVARASQLSKGQRVTFSGVVQQLVQTNVCILDAEFR